MHQFMHVSGRLQQECKRKNVGGVEQGPTVAENLVWLLSVSVLTEVSMGQTCPETDSED